MPSHTCFSFNHPSDVKNCGILTFLCITSCVNGIFSELIAIGRCAIASSDAWKLISPLHPRTSPALKFKLQQIAVVRLDGCSSRSRTMPRLNTYTHDPTCCPSALPTLHLCGYILDRFSKPSPLQIYTVNFILVHLIESFLNSFSLRLMAIFLVLSGFSFSFPRISVLYSISSLMF